MIRYPTKVIIKLNQEMLDGLKDAATEDRRSVSGLIRLILEDWLVERVKDEL